jgi:hypothetical protein
MDPRISGASFGVTVSVQEFMMFEARAIIKSAFSSSLGNLASQYEVLTAMTPASREEYYSYANEYFEETEKLINSDKTNSAITLLLQFQYLSRFKHKLLGGDNWQGANGRSMRHMVDCFSHVCIMAKAPAEVLEQFKKFVYETPSFDQFCKVSFQGLFNVDFYTRVEFVTNELYGIRFPFNEEQEIGGWVASAGLLEENWGWEYENKIDDWNRRWFKSKTSRREIEKEREERRKEVSCFLITASSFYSILNSSNQWLRSLKSRELESSIRVRAINTAYKAIHEGVKLKHLLLEEGHELAKACGEITRGL